MPPMYFLDLLQIAFRSIRQRGVASLLTMFSMSLGVTLVVAVLSIHGVVDRSFRNNASLGYNLIVGGQGGGREQLTLSSVYYLSQPLYPVSGNYYLEFMSRKERDAQMVHSFAHRGHEASNIVHEIRQLTSLGGPLDLIAENMLDPVVEKQDAVRADLGRPGKYSHLTEFAIPICLGDYYDRFRVVATNTELFDTLVYDIENKKKFEFAQGRNFRGFDKEHTYFEAVVGSAVARELNIKLGQEFSPSHGYQGGGAHASKFTVVGILKPSGTPNDRAVFINMEGFYLMEGHSEPIDEAKQLKSQAEEMAAIEKLPKEQRHPAWLNYLERTRSHETAPNQEPLAVEQRKITALLLKTPLDAAIDMDKAINKGKEAQAVMPIAVITGMFDFIIDPIQVMLLTLTTFICIVSGVSILVSIYNSMSERRQEIAIMRALGAGRGTVMTIILLESTLLSLGGGLAGWVFGHLLCLIASPKIEEQTGVNVGLNLWGDPFYEPLRWFGMDGGIAERLVIPMEWTLIPGLVLLAIVVGLWPGVAAYRTDVAKSLGK
ncbi:MAG: ABC transporter permease [Pirellulaceae bacterium]|nr:ABC transporter permease [Pirellulaceae bacterium]